MDIIFPPYTCTGQEEVLDVFLIDPDGNYYNCVRMSECDAEWSCRLYDTFIGVGPGWTWRVRVGPETYPPGYMDPPIDPEDPPVDPEDPPVDPDPEPPVQSDPPTNP